MSAERGKSYMTTRRQSGFGVVPVIVIIATVAALGFVGYKVYTVQSSKPTTNNATANNQTRSVNNQQSGANQSTVSPQVQIVASEDNKVSFTLPIDWHVVKHLPTTTCVLGEPDPCTLYATLSPNDFTNESQWYAIAYKTALSPRAWAEEYPLGSPTEAWKDQSDAKINGYDSFYVTIDNSSYHDLNYFIAHDGYIIYLRFREVIKGGSAGAVQDLSKYSDQFNQIARSVKFN